MIAVYVFRHGDNWSSSFITIHTIVELTVGCGDSTAATGVCVGC